MIVLNLDQTNPKSAKKTTTLAEVMQMSAEVRFGFGSFLGVSDITVH